MMMKFEEVYSYFVLKQNRKMHEVGRPGDIDKDFNWECFFNPKKEITTYEDKECGAFL